MGILLPLLKTQAKSGSFFQTTVHATDLYSIKESDQNISWPNLMILADWGELKRTEKGEELFLWQKSTSIVGQLLSSVELLAVGIPLP